MKVSIYRIAFTVSFAALDISFDSESSSFYSFRFWCFGDDFGYPRFLIEVWKFVISANPQYAPKPYVDEFDDIPF